MFARSSKSAFICLKCRLQLAQRSPHSQWLFPSDQIRNQSQRRWQSAAVAVVEDVQDHEDNPESPCPKSRPKPKYKGEKHWRPKPTAKLGVPSLGRPAEVLLLDERDRLIPKAPLEPEDGRKGDVLIEAWNTQNQSLSPEQLTKNIEHIRDQALQSPDRYHEDGRQLRKRLQQGFSAKQLRNYIEQKQGGSATPWKKKSQRKKQKLYSSEKPQMVSYIFRHIWGIRELDVAEARETVETEVSKQVAMLHDFVEALLLADTSSLKQISSDHKVQIDFFRRPAKILVSGPLGSVKAAQEAIVKLQSKIKTQNISITDPERVGADIIESPLFAEIRQRYGVHLTGSKRFVKVYYHVDKPRDLAAIRRDLWLAQRQATELSHCIVWPKVSSATSSQVFVYLSDPDSNEGTGTGKRFIASQEQAPAPSMPQMSILQKASFSEIYKSYREAMAFPAKQSQLILKPAGTRIETRASFGQVLINDSVSKGNDVHMITRGMKASFITQIPLLAQFLAKRKLWKDDGPQTSSAAPSQSPDHGAVDKVSPLSEPLQFRYELLLTSVRQSISLPSFRIQLVGADANLGLGQPLQIKAVSAIFAKKTSHLLLPSQSVDIQFESLVLQDIYREGIQSDVEHEKLLSKLAEYFSKADLSPAAQFSPFTSLCIPVDLRRRHNLSLLDNNGLDPKKDHEYILESAEALDIASYRPPFLSKLCLDHVVFMSDDIGDGRQILQLTERPRLALPSKQKTSSASFFNSAYEIALLLGDSTLLRKS